MLHGPCPACATGRPVTSPTLTQFIRANIELLSAEWETVARLLTPDVTRLTADELRDHVPDLLVAIAGDLEAHRSPDEQKDFARGATDFSPAITAYAREHAQTRLDHGFTLQGMAAEYRALRESVLRQWEVELRASAADSREQFRFNQSVDHAWTEAMTWYGQQLDKARDLFIGTLAHDLRNPLGAVQMSARLLLVDQALGAESANAAMRVFNSSARMRGLVDQLLDFTRIRLGHRLPVKLERTDLAALLPQAVDELTAYHAGVDVRLDCDGELVGEWDSRRIGQVISNLLGNAIEHGELGKPVTVSARADAERVLLWVHNEGEPIPADLLTRLFDPLTRGVVQQRDEKTDSEGMGLGLLIAHQIVVAHGGRIDVTSTAQHGTTFSVQLPKWRRPGTE